jgi:hypothetical protein
MFTKILPLQNLKVAYDTQNFEFFNLFSHGSEIFMQILVADGGNRATQMGWQALISSFGARNSG